MAQTNFTPISLYYSATAAVVPTAGNLVAGELALNTNDGKLYYKDSAGVVQVIAGKGGAGVAGGSNTQVQYNSSGSLAGSANLTFNGTTLTTANDASISGFTVGYGAGGGFYQNAVFGVSALGASTTGAYNTAIGISALRFNTTASNNTAVGYTAGYSNTTGTSNTYLGGTTGYSNTTGSSNTGVGELALGNSTTGANNTALGKDALRLNTTASNNTAVGYQAGYSNTTGSTLVAIGYQAGYSTTTGVENTFLGTLAGYSNSTGNYNSFVGRACGYSTTTGQFNTALGVQSLGSNTTASNNTAVGYQAGYSTTTGANNLYAGYQAGYTNAAGGFNIFMGYQAGFTASGGANSANICIGTLAGYSLTTGTLNTFVGGSPITGGAGQSVTTGSKNTILGAYNGNQGGLDIRTASNYIVLSDGDGNPRGIFDGSGNFLVGTTSSGGWQTSAPKGVFQSGNVAASVYCTDTGTNDALAVRRDVTFGSLVRFYNSTTSVGTITYNGTAVLYNATSDYRLKNVIGAVTDAGTRIDALEPIEYDFKTGGRTKGFLAHKFAEVYPNSVSGEKDAVDKDGNPSYQAMQASSAEVMADLIAEIQSLRKRVALLESK